MAEYVSGRALFINLSAQIVMLAEYETSTNLTVLKLARLAGMSWD